MSTDERMKLADKIMSADLQWLRDGLRLTDDESMMIAGALRGSGGRAQSVGQSREQLKADWTRHMATVTADRETAEHIVNLAELNGLFDTLRAPEAADAGIYERAEIYEAALKRIAISRMNDFSTLHPEGCAAEASDALRKASAISLSVPSTDGNTGDQRS